MESETLADSTRAISGAAAEVVSDLRNYSQVAGCAVCEIEMRVLQDVLITVGGCA
jgi:hypothetical protein